MLVEEKRLLDEISRRIHPQEQEIDRGSLGGLEGERPKTIKTGKSLPLAARPISQESAEIDALDVVEALRRREGVDQPAALPTLECDIVEIDARESQTPCRIDCPACRNRQGRPLYEVRGTRFRLAACTRCGTGQLDPRPSPSEIASFYPPAYYGSDGVKFSPVVERGVREAARWKARQLTRDVPRGGRILDVGCGRGTVLRAVADRGFEAHGLEISETAVEGIDPRAIVRIAPSLIEARYPARHFDAIILWHVLEHLSDPREILAEARRILKPGGRIHISVPNFSSWQARWSGRGWFHLDLPRHLHHFTSRSLCQLIEESGFAVRRERHFSFRQNPYGWLQSALNLWPGAARNRLYSLLKRNAASRSTAAFRGARWTSLALAMALAPFACIVSLLETLFRNGGTVHVEGVLAGSPAVRGSECPEKMPKLATRTRAK